MANLMLLELQNGDWIKAMLLAYGGVVMNVGGSIVCTTGRIDTTRAGVYDRCMS